MSDLPSAREIAHALGGKPIGRGQCMTKCPSHQERTGSLSVREGHSGPLVHCHAGCSQGDVIAALWGLGLWHDRGDNHRVNPSVPRRDEAKPKRSEVERIAYARRVWGQAIDPRGTIADEYLARRGLALPDEAAGRVLRFHPNCAWEQRTAPALIAAFTPIGEPDADAPPVAVLRRGLTADGTKLGKPRALGPVKGAVIKVDADEAVTLGIGICEGLEDALDIRQRGWRPMWCLGSEGAMRTFPVLPGIEALSIFADADPVGLDAGKQCAERWRAAGAEAEIMQPRTAKDWNEEGSS